MFCFVWLCFTDTSILIEYYQLRVACGIKAANDMPCDNDKVLIISMPQESRTTCRIGKHELSLNFWGHFRPCQTWTKNTLGIRM